jgi:salicylate hydroxylase
MLMKIAIVGAGIGGLAAALALAQAGFTVEVYERAPALLDQGAGITMAPNATRVLFNLGLEPALVSTAAAPSSTDYRHYRTGFVFKRIDHQSSRERFGYPHLRFHRWDLQEAMVGQLNLIAPGALRLGWRLEGLTQGDRGVELSFADGRAITAELVVGADGIRSTVRDLLFGPTAATFTGFAAWRGLVLTAGLSPSLAGSVVSFGNGRNIVRYPVRRGELVNFVAAARRDGWEAEGWTIPASHDEFLAEFADFDDETRALIARPQLGSLFKWGLFGRTLLPSWRSGRVVLLGDAAHPMLPFLGQGGAMAIEDAMVLSRALALESDPERALSRYEEARRPRAIATTERAANQGQIWDGEPNADSVDERVSAFSYDAVSGPI